MTDERRREINQLRADTLLPELKDKLLAGLLVLEDLGWQPLVAQALRTPEEQTALYAQGRQSLDEVNELRKTAGQDPITEKENEHIVTKIKWSKHNEGKAFDLVNIKDGKADWDDMKFYSACANEFEAMDLIWGGRWTKFVDHPHFELA